MYQNTPKTSSSSCWAELIFPYQAVSDYPPCTLSLFLSDLKLEPKLTDLQSIVCIRTVSYYPHCNLSLFMLDLNLNLKLEPKLNRLAKYPSPCNLSFFAGSEFVTSLKLQAM